MTDRKWVLIYEENGETVNRYFTMLSDVMEAVQDLNDNVHFAIFMHYKSVGQD